MRWTIGRTPDRGPGPARRACRKLGRADGGRRRAPDASPSLVAQAPCAACPIGCSKHSDRLQQAVVSMAAITTQNAPLASGAWPRSRPPARRASRASRPSAARTPEPRTRPTSARGVLGSAAALAERPQATPARAAAANARAAGRATPPKRGSSAVGSPPQERRCWHPGPPAPHRAPHRQPPALGVQVSNFSEPAASDPDPLAAGGASDARLRPKNLRRVYSFIT